MPSGPAHWHEHWKGDYEALSYLQKRGFKNDRGVIRRPEGLEPDSLDYAAIDYLFAEWDYEYGGADRIEKDRAS